MVPRADFEGKFWKEEDGEKSEERVLSFPGLNNPKAS